MHAYVRFPTRAMRLNTALVNVRFPTYESNEYVKNRYNMQAAPKINSAFSLLFDFGKLILNLS